MNSVAISMRMLPKVSVLIVSFLTDPMNNIFSEANWILCPICIVPSFLENLYVHYMSKTTIIYVSLSVEIIIITTVFSILH